ncbi:dihydrofolate reductase family protein [Catenulispora yoronensis]|uniref:Dihydrofolate reductase family protein n=1 Tax=Catenulispora yoronensis TaxID=450799 RepID=A0ABN2VLC0_9ACTN
MRKMVAFEHLTVDGFASSGQGIGIEWTFRAYSDELAAYAQDHIQADFDMAVYGRETYLGMYGYWGAKDAGDGSEQERKHATWVNALDKVVVSTTLESADWNNTRLVKGDLTKVFTELKEQEGGTIAVYASPKLVQSLVDLELIDEYRLVIHPVVIGSGTPLFKEKSALELDLLESKAFASGAVYVRYQVG